MLRARQRYSSRPNAKLITVLLLSLILPLASCDRFGARSPEEHIGSAIEYRAQGDLNAAVIELKNALQQNPDNAKGRLLLGKTYLESGQGRAAEKELRRAISLGVAERDIAPELARAMLMQGRYQEVLDALDRHTQVDAARRAEALIIRGGAEQGLGKTDQACADYQRASKLDTENLSALLGLASCDILQKRYDPARARVAELLEGHPEHVQSWIMLGRIEAAAKQSQAAIDAFGKALELSPRQPTALLGRAQVRLTENQLDAAEADIELLHKVAPSSAQANHLLGFLRFRQGRFDDAAVAYHDALRADSDFDPAIIWLGLTHYAQHDYEQAIQQFSRFLQKHPDAVRVKVLLALSQAQVGGNDAAVKTLRQLQGLDIEDPKVLAAIGQAALSAGDSAAGRQYFEQAVARAPDRATLRMALANVLLQTGETQQAIEELDIASQLDEEDIRADVVLVRTLIAKRRLEQALQAIDRVAAKAPESDLPHVLRGLVFLLDDRRDAAREAFELAVRKDRSSIGGHHGLAVLDTRAKDIAAANNHYRAVLEARPGHLQTELALSSLAARAGDRAKALGWLEQAAKDNPQSAIAAGLYARQLLAQGKTRQAQLATGKALRANPDHVGLRYIRGVALLAQGKSRAAANVYQELIDTHPDFIPSRVQLARAREQTGDTDGARKALAEARELSPRHKGVTVALIELEARAKNFTRALALVQEIDQQNPNTALGPLLEAQIRVRQSNVPQAIETLRSAARAHPQSRAVVRMLARLQWNSGAKEASVDTLAGWREAHPEDLRMARELGDRHLLMGRNKEAAEVYRKVIEVHPQDAAVLNNLALASWPHDRAQAMSFARKANQLHPQNPALQDTWGWMLVEDGQIKPGLELLASARERLGESATVRYHYAAALARAGKPSAARQELRSLLAEADTFPEKSDAQALLEKL